LVRCCRNTDSESCRCKDNFELIQAKTLVKGLVICCQLYRLGRAVFDGLPIESGYGSD